jgi:hypothetical protein
VLRAFDLESYRERAEAILKELGVSPKLRQNGVLGFEDIYGASAEYWGDDWRDRAEDIEHDPLIQEIMAFAKKRYGRSLVSVSLHLDESYPHVHVVSLALAEKEHHQRGRKPKDPSKSPPPVRKWSLAARDLRGGPAYMLESAHDAFAAAVEHLGLERGSRGSELTEEERRARKQGRTKVASAKVAAERRAAERASAEAEDLTFLAEKNLENSEKAIRQAQAETAAANEKTAAASRERDSAAADRQAAAVDRQAASKSRRDAETEAKVTRDTAAGELATAKIERKEAEKARAEAATDRMASAGELATAKTASEQAQQARDAAEADRTAAAGDRAAARVDREKAAGAATEVARGVRIAVEQALLGTVKLAGSSAKPAWDWLDHSAGRQFGEIVKAAGAAAWQAVWQTLQLIRSAVAAAKAEQLGAAVSQQDIDRQALSLTTGADAVRMLAARTDEERQRVALEVSARAPVAASEGQMSEALRQALKAAGRDVPRR